MTSTLDIITAAYRESNINAIGVVPSEPQQTEGLRLLVAVVSSVMGFEVGENLRDWQVGTVGLEDPRGWSEEEWRYPPANVRLLISAATSQTLYLPERPSDGARVGLVDVLGDLDTRPVTINGNGRLIDDQPELTVNVAGSNIMWFYRADLGRWVTVVPVTLDGQMPFPDEFDDAFTTMLAMRLNPRYGRAMAQESAGWMTRSLMRLAARYRQKVVVAADAGVLTSSVQAYGQWGGTRGPRGWMS